MKDYQSPRSYSLMVLKTHSQKEDKSQKKIEVQRDNGIGILLMERFPWIFSVNTTWEDMAQNFG